MKVELKTLRLRLRPPQISDAKRIAELAGDVDIAKNTGTLPHPYHEPMAVEWIAGVQQRPEDTHIYTFMIDPTAIGHAIGCIGFHVDWDHKKTEIGYWIGKPFWGRGYTSEAAQAVVDYCFGELELNRIEATYHTSNIGSRRVMEKIGMTYEGTQRQAIIRRLPALDYKKVHDLGMFSILRDEWLANRN